MQPPPANNPTVPTRVDQPHQELTRRAEAPTSLLPQSPLPLDPPIPDSPLPAPGPALERIESIDVLRGFALLGILVVNIQSFAMIEAAYLIPTTYGDFSGANFWVWAFTHVLADQKMMTIFSMLFGAGIVLMTGNRERAGRPPAAAHYRRMAALLLFGLIHAYGLWYGDILFTYAVCGMLAYPLRRLRPAWLLPIGVALLAVGSGVSLLSGWSVRFWPPEMVAEFNASSMPPPQAVADELATYRGGWLRQMDHRLPSALTFQAFILPVWGVWRVLGLMLVGMALFKAGVFSAARPVRFYVSLACAGFLVGIPVVVYGAYRNFAEDWRPLYAYFVGMEFNYWASVAVALGWVALVMLLCKAGPRAAAATGPLAAVGRMALTNYLLQTVICTTIFYGHGLGLFGRVQRVGQLAIVVAVWALQLILSPVYLRYFRMGPAEWLWRWMTYLRAPPLRRGRSGTGPAACAPPAAP